MARTKGPRFSVSFVLVTKQGGSSGHILCTITHKGERVRFAIGQNRIPIEEWDSKTQERRGSGLEALATNERIRAVKRLITQALEQDKDLKAIQAMATGVETVRKSKGIKALYDRFLKARQDLAPATVKAFNVSLRALEAYEKQTEPITLNTFQADSPTARTHARAIVKDLTNWLVNEYGYNDNTTTKALRHLTTVIRWHVSEGHTGAIPINVPIGKREPIEAREMPALTKQDVEALWNLDLPPNQNLWHCRNGFVFACHTGLRYSDWAKADPTKWKEAYQVISQQKTGESARVLHTEEVRAVLRIYEATGWPPCIAKITNSAIVNELIKTACRMAKLTRKVPNVVRKNGRDVIGPEHELCDVVTTHTARRTFVTIRQNAGDSNYDIMERTGHQSEKTMKGYDRTTAEQFATRYGVTAYKEDTQTPVRSTAKGAKSKRTKQ